MRMIKEGKVSMKIQPLADRVIVKRLPSEEKTSGGLFIPGNAQERPQTGLVVAVGAGKLREDGQRQTPAVREGDKVLFGKHSGAEMKVEGEEIVILREEDILAVIES